MTGTPMAAAALAGVPAGVQAQGVWAGRRQLFVRFAGEAETATMYTAAALVRELERQLLRSKFHSIAIGGRDPLANLAFLIAALASSGLPSLNNFVGEYLILQGVAFTGFAYAAAAAVGVILSAVYLLWSYQRIFLGPKPDNGTADLSGTETLAIAPLILLMIVMGVWSTSFLPLQSAVNAKILQQTKMNVEFRVETLPSKTTPSATTVEAHLGN